jgi:hypothetical protein
MVASLPVGCGTYLLACQSLMSSLFMVEYTGKTTGARKALEPTRNNPLKTRPKKFEIVSLQRYHVQKPTILPA